jgi:hypothetical protein
VQNLKREERKPDPRRVIDDDSCDFEGKPLGYNIQVIRIDHIENLCGLLLFSFN